MNKRPLFERSNVVEDLNDRRDRLKKAKELKKRLVSLSKRKNNPVSLRQLCEKHGLPTSATCKALNGTVLPRPATLEKIEAALEKEEA